MKQNTLSDSFPVNSMKITVITGSPHRNGTSALLADQFIAGAREAGHEVFRFDAAFEKVHPCFGCDKCRFAGEKCVHRDAMDTLNPHLLAADMVVLVTPLYYFGMSAQIKAVIDRFYANNYALMESSKRAVLLATAADDQARTMDALISHYKAVVSYLGWEEAGILSATGCARRSDMERTSYPEVAKEMGRSCGSVPDRERKS